MGGEETVLEGTSWVRKGDWFEGVVGSWKGSLGLGRQKPEKGRRDMELRKDKGRGPQKERM